MQSQMMSLRFRGSEPPRAGSRGAGAARARLRVSGAGGSELSETGGPMGVNEVLDLLATVQAGSKAGPPATATETATARFRRVLVTSRRRSDPSEEVGTVAAGGAGEGAGEWSAGDVSESRMVVRADPGLLPSWFAIEGL